MVGGSAPVDASVTLDHGAYMSVDGTNDYLVIAHTEALALGKDGADYTVSFALLQTTDSTDGWRNLIHKGHNDGQRSPAIWKWPATTSLHARIDMDTGGN